MDRSLLQAIGPLYLLVTKQLVDSALEACMWSICKFFFRKEAVVAELKGGALQSPRIRDFLLFTLLFTTALRMIGGVGSIFGKIEPSAVTGILIAGGVVILVLILVYFVLRFMLLSLYEANGGEQGQNFLERLMALGISAMVRITPFCLVVGLLIGLLFGLVPGPAWVGALMGLGPLALMIGIIVWVYFDLKDGFLKLRA